MRHVFTLPDSGSRNMNTGRRRPCRLRLEACTALLTDGLPSQNMRGGQSAEWKNKLTEFVTSRCIVSGINCNGTVYFGQACPSSTAAMCWRRSACAIRPLHHEPRLRGSREA